MSSINPQLREALLKEDWELLYKQAVLFAQLQVDKKFWRGKKRGVLPDGHDASSIAADTVARVFEEDGKLTPGYMPEELEKELQRHVMSLVHLLVMRSENTVVRNEPELKVPQGEDGEAVAVWDAIPNPSASPREAAAQAEELERLVQFRKEFETFAGADKEVKDLFGCICDGFEKREEIAARLGVEVDVLKNTKRRLRRQLAEFAKVSNDPWCLERFSDRSEKDSERKRRK